MDGRDQGFPVKKPPDGITKSFADVVAGNKGAIFEIKNPELFKGEPAVFFSDEDIKILSEPFKFALIGKFNGGRPSMEVIRKFFVKLSLKAHFNIGLMDSKHILIQLNNEEDYHRVWIRQNWTIFQYNFCVSKWHANFTSENESPIMPIWVSMPYLPPHLFKKEAILSIAKTIGNPMRIDTSTATLARPSKARVCIEVDISKSLPKRAWIGQGDQGFWQNFQYENMPYYCHTCNRIGHETNRCIMEETNKDNNLTAQNKANEEIRKINIAQNKAQIWKKKGKGKIDLQQDVHMQDKCQQELGESSKAKETIETEKEKEELGGKNQENIISDINDINKEVCLPDEELRSDEISKESPAGTNNNNPEIEKVRSVDDMEVGRTENEDNISKICSEKIYLSDGEDPRLSEQEDNIAVSETEDENCNINAETTNTDEMKGWQDAKKKRRNKNQLLNNPDNQRITRTASKIAKNLQNNVDNVKGINMEC